MGLRHRGATILTGGAIGLASVSGCSRAEPPAPAGPPWLAAPEGDAAMAAVGPSAPSDAHAEHVDRPATLPSASASALPSPAASSTTDSASLPQTTDKPASSGASLDQRIGLLWTAIVRDDPDAATPAFFPLGAYQQVKDVTDPGADWRRRLLAAFHRDIHTFHAVLGDDAGAARLVSFDVPDARARWVEPGEEWNKIGYYRVFGSKMRYEIGGAERAFEVKSLISWRGEWYVVHLAAIK
jgi:hypothetical protein